MLTQSEAALYLQRLRTDFTFFLQELWRDRQLFRFAPLGWPELELAEFAANGPKRRGILAPRGTGKTHFVTAALSVYRLRRDRNRRILIESKSASEAKKTLSLCREWLDRVWFLQDLAPTRECRDTTTYFDIATADENRQPSITALGIDGQLPGNRAHTIIPDDVETPANTQTVAARAKLAEILNENEQILYAPGPDEYLPDVHDPAEIVEVGTYHHEESVYKSEASKGFVFITMPLLFPEPGEKQMGLAPGVTRRLASGEAKPGDIVFSHRLDSTYVADKRKRGRRSFLMQQQLVCDLADSNRYPLKLADLIVIDSDPLIAPNYLSWGQTDHNGSTALEIPSIGLGNDRLYRPAMRSADTAPYSGTKAGIDPAGRGEDEIGYGAVAHLNGFLHLKGFESLEGGYSEDNLSKLATFLRRDRVGEVYIESNYGGGMFDELFAPVLRRHFLRPGDDPAYPDGWACTIVQDTKITHATGQKEVRIIDTLEPWSSTHRFVANSRVAADTRFQEQWTRITREPGSLPHLHGLDAVALAVKAWQFAGSTDTTAAAARTRQKQEQDKHDAFWRQYGRKPANPPTFYKFRK